MFLSYRCPGEGDIKVYGLDYTGFCKLKKKIAKREKINKKKSQKIPLEKKMVNVIFNYVRAKSLLKKRKTHTW